MKIDARLPLFPLSRFYIAKGDSARNRHDWTLAATQYQNALAVYPDNAAIWVQLGHALKESNRLEQAEECYRKAIALRPSDADSYLQLGHALKLLGKAAEASDAYARANEINPAMPAVVEELANLGREPANANSHGNRQSGIRDGGPWQALSADLTKFPAMPENYTQIFSDVALLIRLGLISSPEQHYQHYGYRQGRDIVASLAVTPPSRAFILCPSFFKRCGIGEHARYLADCIERSGLETRRIRSTHELRQQSVDEIKDAVLIVNHGPGLFDGYNPELSEGETTSDLLTTLLGMFRTHNLRPVIFMHSLLDRDNEVMFPRQQLALETPIPVVTTIESAAKVFNIFRVEHGMQPMEVPERPERKLKFGRDRDHPAIGFFGFFQWGGKNFDALFNAAESLKAKLVGSVATRSDAQVQQLREMLTERDIKCDLGTGWVEDNELARRLAEADIHYLPQNDYDHWNNSGTARFVMNFGRPVIVPPHNPFLDLRDFAIFAEEHDFPAIVSCLRDDSEYQEACQRSKDYATIHPMQHEMPRLASGMPELVSESGADNFISPGDFSAFRLLGLPEEAFAARIAYLIPDSVANHDAAGAPDTEARYQAIAKLRQNMPGVLELDYPVVEGIQYWRNHYEISDFLSYTGSELCFAAYRCVLKRDPDYVEYDYGLNILEMKINNSGSIPPVRKIISLLSYVQNKKINLPFATQVHFYHQGLAVKLDDRLINQLDDQMDIVISKRQALMSSLQKSSRPRQTRTGTLNDRNLFSLLTLGSDTIGDALRTAAQAAGCSIAFDDIDAIDNPAGRFMAVLNAITTVGARPSKIFVMDAPIAESVNNNRSSYSVAEFWAYEGDDFIVNLVRCLRKRDPLTDEFIALREAVARKGKLGAIRALNARSGGNATVVDIDANHDEAVLEARLDEVRVLIQQFRSPVAGGWELRNQYLECKRNNARFWLKNKEKEEIWWHQTGKNIARILSNY